MLLVLVLAHLMLVLTVKLELLLLCLLVCGERQLSRSVACAHEQCGLIEWRILIDNTSTATS